MSSETDRLYWRIRNAEYLAANREKVNAARRARYARKREEVLAGIREYRAANAERFREQARARYHRSKANA